MLHPWVSFIIMPLFALANAGVAVTLSDFGDPVAIAVAAGIGFTMALFIAGLALDCPTLDAAKVGILGASAVAAILAMVVLTRFLPNGSHVHGSA